jgi:hypothetical protein
MTPLPVNPTVVILINEDGLLKRVATNVDAETKVVVTTDATEFETEALGKPFNFTPTD